MKKSLLFVVVLLVLVQMACMEPVSNEWLATHEPEVTAAAQVHEAYAELDFAIVNLGADSIMNGLRSCMLQRGIIMTADMENFLFAWKAGNKWRIMFLDANGQHISNWMEIYRKVMGNTAEYSPEIASDVVNGFEEAGWRYVFAEDMPASFLDSANQYFVESVFNTRQIWPTFVLVPLAVVKDNLETGFEWINNIPGYENVIVVGVEG